MGYNPSFCFLSCRYNRNDSWCLYIFLCSLNLNIFIYIQQVKNIIKFWALYTLCSSIVQCTGALKRSYDLSVSSSWDPIMVVQVSYIFLSPVNFNFKNFKFSYLLFVNFKFILNIPYLINFFSKNILLVFLVKFLPSKYSVSQKPLTEPLLFLIFIVVEQVQQQ